VIVGRGVSDISTSVVGHDRDVIAHFVLVGVTEKRIERLTHGNVWCPSVATVGAVGIEELRIRIVRGISAIEPHDIDPPIRRDRKRAEPMPFGLVHRVIIDPDWGAKTQTAIRASNKHDVSATARACRLDTRQHINVTVCARAGTIDREEDLPN
jgi:hypothetical protein